MLAPKGTPLPTPTSETPVPEASCAAEKTDHEPSSASSAAVPPHTGTPGKRSASAAITPSSAPGVLERMMACGSAIRSRSAAAAAAPSSALKAVARPPSAHESSRQPTAPGLAPAAVRRAALEVRP